MGKAKELISSITGKGTTMTAKALVNVKLKLEREIASLLKKEKLSDEQKKQLAGKKKQLRDVKAEMADEADKAGRSLAQGASDARSKKKLKPLPILDDPKAKLDTKPTYKDKEELMRIIKEQEAQAKPKARNKGGVMQKAMPFNKGGMPSRKGNFDMRKGGMFAK